MAVRRPRTNFIEGAGIDITVADNPTLEAADVTIATTGAPPTGAAGGVLSGTYPNPGFASDMATQAELDAHITDTADAHDASAISVADAGGYYTGTEVEAALQQIGAGLGRWELVMQDGVTAPPVPVETEAQDDWLYVLVED
jgi:hypothetical protein